MKRGWLLSLALGVFLCASEGAQAAAHVFKFSDPAQASAWEIASQTLEPLTLSRRFGVFGGYALRFASPAWKGNLPQWPSCQAAPEVKDWSGYDRLVLDLTNPGKADQSISFFVSDSKVPFRKGLGKRCQVPGGTSERFVFKLNKWPSGVNRKDVSIMHFFTERPGADMELFIGSVYLLRPGEAFPVYPSAFVAQLRELYMPLLANCRSILSTTMTRLRKDVKLPALVEHLKRTNGTFEVIFKRYEELMGKRDLTMEELQELRKFVSKIENRCHRLESELVFLKKAVEAGQDISKMLVGTASTMTKVMPRDVGFEADVVKNVTVKLARNEREGVQIVVNALTENLQDVDVTLSPLKNGKGEELTSAEVDVVGFVETLKRPPYVVSYVGWWPDPLLRHSRNGKAQTLNHCDKVAITQGDSQAFWLRFYAAKNQTPGTYEGTVTVKAKGVKPYAMPVAVQVYPFTLPDNTALPTAISFSPQMKSMTQKLPWSKMKYIYADFLADYQIDYDNLYRKGAPDWDIVQYLHKQGRLTAFNLGNVFNAGVSPKTFEQQMKQTVERLRPAYEKAKELGVLDYAYIYGFDERGKDQFPLLEKCAQALRKEFPGALIMTTSYDHSFGLDSVVKSMQAWCPLTPRYEMKQVKKAWDSGRWVWWYICCGPHNPYANWFVEYAAIESRLLMGAQTVKYRPDGFLYYATTIWNENMGIDCAKGPFTNWNPVSWTVYHGDGSLFYCDKDGYPLPSIRLENYRDGQEDYAYACILEEAVKQVKAKKTLTDADKTWLAEAEAALVVPESLVKTMAVYSRDPKQVMAWRTRMAEAIVKSGLTNLNPWKGVFGARGWRK